MVEFNCIRPVLGEPLQNVDVARSFVCGERLSIGGGERIAVACEQGACARTTVMGFEPWLSVGAEYMRDQQTSNPTISNVPVTFTLVHHGVAIPIGLGVDYRFLEVFGIGPSFFYTPVIAAAGCAGADAQGYVSTNYCTNSTPKITEANAYGVWSLGLDARVTLF